MVKWKISEPVEISDGSKELFVYSPLTKRECLLKENLKGLIETDKLKFSLVYTNSNKMIGYHFEYKNPPENHHTITDRMVSWFFDGKKTDPQINVLFEDQNIRLLAYEEAQKETDYWLVGRWRDVN